MKKRLRHQSAAALAGSQVAAGRYSLMKKRLRLIGRSQRVADFPAGRYSLMKKRLRQNARRTASCARSRPEGIR